MVSNTATAKQRVLLRFTEVPSCCGYFTREEFRCNKENVPSSETLRAEEVCPCWAGAKAAAEAMREARMAVFILIILFKGIVVISLC